MGPNTWVISLSPPGGWRADLKALAVSEYLAVNPTDRRTVFVDVSDLFPTTGMVRTIIPSQWANDGTHVNAAANARLGVRW